MKLVYTDVAIEDLKRLRAFIAAHNPPVAARVATELVGRIRLLPDFPEMGTPVELAPVPASRYKDALHNLAEESLKRTH